MELSGKLFQIMPAQTGTGKNGPWKKTDFVIETVGDKYPKKVCITAWSELADQIENVALNSDVKVSFDISSREYNGKWYTDVKAWKINADSSSQSSQSSGGRQIIPENNYNPSADDLPF